MKLDASESVRDNRRMETCKNRENVILSLNVSADELGIEMFNSMTLYWYWFSD